MPSILRASTVASLDGKVRSELWFDVFIDGVYIDPRDGQERIRYELTGYTVRHVVERKIIRKENGIHRVSLPDALSLSGRKREILDRDNTESTYVLTRAEKTALRSLNPSGLPLAFQLAWEREIRGPMSPTFEQSVVAENESSADGLTFTVTSPTSGNLLVICHGNFDGDASSPSLSSGFTLGTTATPPNFQPSMNILHKIAAGTEGTSIVVTHTTGEADPNSGAFFEISGMESTSYTDGFNNTPSNGTVTSRSSGSVTTTDSDVLLIAAWGYQMDTSPTGFGYSNSFTQQASIEGVPTAADHATRVATRVVSATGSFSSTLSWTNGTDCGGTIGAFKIVTATAPSATVPGDGICINTYGETAVEGISVTEGTSSIVSVATTCTAGNTLTYNTSGTSVTVSGNGTNAATLLNGANETEYNTVLGTLTMRGTTVDTTATVTVIPTDGTLNDNETFDVYCDPDSLTATGSNDDVIAWVASMKVRILGGQTNDTISVHVEDDTGTPIEVDSNFIVGLSSYFSNISGFGLLNSLRRRRKKKSGN